MINIRDITGTGGKALRQAVLRDGDVSLSLLNYGATTQDWRVPCQGEFVPVVLGYTDPCDYLGDPNYLGAIIGRVANRTTPARFDLDGIIYHLTPNEGVTHLHGGSRGLHHRFWDMEADSKANAVRFDYRSEDGEEGYPGDVAFSITVSLSGTTVTYDMQARADRRTPVNMAQHNYYNLAGRGHIWDQRMTSVADRFLPLGPDKLPTGEIFSAAGSRYDFCNNPRFADNDPMWTGTDINMVFPTDCDPATPVARFESPNGLTMQVWSDQPGAQLYTGAFLATKAPGHGGRVYAPFSGFCFEPQKFPNASNIGHFSSILIDPDQPYRQKLVIDISETTL